MPDVGPKKTLPKGRGNGKVPTGKIFMSFGFRPFGPLKVIEPMSPVTFKFIFPFIPHRKNGKSKIWFICKNLGNQYKKFEKIIW